MRSNSIVEMTSREKQHKQLQRNANCSACRESLEKGSGEYIANLLLSYPLTFFYLTRCVFSALSPSCALGVVRVRCRDRDGHRRL